jgi:RNA polymerase sigma-70 factor (ECF subfamily)
VFARIGQFDGSSRIETWVYRVAVNEGLQFLRRRKTGDRVIRGRAFAGERGDGEGAAADVRLDVEVALARLPEEERTLLLLRYYQGLNYAEMAEVLEKPPGTVAWGLNRARRMLGELLGADFRVAKESGAVGI